MGGSRFIKLSVLCFLDLPVVKAMSYDSNCVNDPQAGPSSWDDGGECREIAAGGYGGKGVDGGGGGVW